jgi:hypothetical protein
LLVCMKVSFEHTKFAYFSLKQGKFMVKLYTQQKKLCFYLPYMEYGESIGFVSRKMKKKIIAHFHALGLFMAKKHDLSEKVFRESCAVAVAVERKICATPTAWTIRPRKLKL